MAQRKRRLTIIGLIIMDIHPDEMIAIVQRYLNSNLLNTMFQEHHKSVVENVRQRSNGRFVIEFRAPKGPLTKSKEKQSDGSDDVS